MNLIKKSDTAPTVGSVFNRLKAASKNVENTGGTFTLILDRSGSMEGEPLRELNRAALAVTKDVASKVQTNIVQFPYPSFMPAQAFRGFDNADGGTPMGEAITYFMLRVPDGSHAVLMSDGHPTDTVTEALIDKCVGRRLVIHTVACGDSADERLLRWIADTTGGTFRHASQPMDLTEVFVALARKAVAALTEGRKELRT